MSSYSIIKSESEQEILKFWEQSPDATIFTHPSVLKKLIDDVKWFVVYKTNEPICIWPFCTPDVRNGGKIKFLYYVGPFWSKIRIELSYSTFFEMAMEAYNLFINEIKNDKSIVDASLPLSLNDVRFFYWINNIVDNSNFKIEVFTKYTAIIYNLNMLDSNEIVRNMNRNRRREINDFLKANELKKCENLIIKDVFKVYEIFYTERNTAINECDRRNLENLCELVLDGFGYYVGYRNKLTNELVSIFISLFGKNVANGVISITLESYKDTKVGTICTIDSIIKSKELGMSSFDFNGANSLIFAKFKHSLGAVPQLYFDLKFIHE